MTVTLSQRALNRATLDRQLLLRRSDRSAGEAVEHLVGLQAQTPHTWYVGLWNRLTGFRPEHVSDLLLDRSVVRVALMRSTIHLVTARDCLALRPLVQPVIQRATAGAFGKRLTGLDPAEMAAAGRQLVDHQPLTFTELGKRLAERWPDRDPAALAQAVRAEVALVQVPPRGVWGRSGLARHTSAEAWLGRPLRAMSPDELVRRYLAAFGPASVMDVQAWSGLTRLAEVVERIRPRLVIFHNEQGKELFDLPDAPRPDPDTPAPPRFMYDFDNVFLSHADRSRFAMPELAQLTLDRMFTRTGRLPGGVLVDGVMKAVWAIARQRTAATLRIEALTRLSTRDMAALTREGRRLLAFAAPDAEAPEVRFGPVYG